MTNKEIAEYFLIQCSAGQFDDVFNGFIARDFIHHNPYFVSDAPSLRKGMEDNSRQYPHKTCQIQRSIAEGDLVVVHSRIRMDPQHPGFAVVHIFRFAEGRIIELWDIGQAVPENMQNTAGMF